MAVSNQNQADELTTLNQLHQHNTNQIHSNTSSLSNRSLSRFAWLWIFLSGSVFSILIVKISNHHYETATSKEQETVIKLSSSKDESTFLKCLNDKKYSSKTVKTAFELPFAGLFKDTKGEKKFEASSLVKVDDTYYAICDNSWAISKFDASLTPFSTSNVQIGNPNREEEDSGYEAILYYNQTFYVVRESIKHYHSDDNSGIYTFTHNKHDKDKVSSSYHAIIEELIVDDDNSDYQIKEQCRCEFEFEGDSKGFEGAFGMPGLDGEFYIVGLCEGNHCSESRKGDKGHGQMVLMKKNKMNESVVNGTSSVDSSCLWETVKMIDIPKTANFIDYSDIEVTPSGKVAITSQENSAFWLGQMIGIEGGVLDPDKIAFNETSYKVFDFPKSNQCQTVYCNIEGITFINDEMIMAVSDKMKKKGKQPYWCLEKDQSIHTFVLP